MLSCFDYFLATLAELDNGDFAVDSISFVVDYRDIVVVEDCVENSIDCVDWEEQRDFAIDKSDLVDYLC